MTDSTTHRTVTLPSGEQVRGGAHYIFEWRTLSEAFHAAVEAEIASLTIEEKERRGLAGLDMARQVRALSESRAA